MTTRYGSASAYVTLLVFGLFFFGVMGELSAQNRDYQLANQLMQQKKFEQACPILEELHNKEPSQFLFFKKRLECLSGLNDLDTAIAVAERQLDLDPNFETKLLLAEILHTGEKFAEAKKLWADVSGDSSAGEAEIHLLVTSLEKRREYSMAAELILKKREEWRLPDWKRQSLSEIYFQGGEFRKGIQELYEWVIEQPQNMVQVQQRLLRMREQPLYETAAIELEDRLFTLDENHAAYGQMYQLLSWLYLETENFERALRFAERYESRSDRARQQVYILALKFRSAHQYPLAVKALEYYDNDETTLRWTAMEEKANTYRQWADYVKERSLKSEPAPADLYNRAYAANEYIYDEYPAYPNVQRVLISLLDLSLDVRYSLQDAKTWLSQLQIRQNGQDSAYSMYATGRIHLFNEEYRNARQFLTRADRLTREANLSEKIRFYLSLSDLYDGDPEFALIQLASLQRRSSSYYANEAIELKKWIQTGLRADSTGSQLQVFTEGYRYLHKGSWELAFQTFQPVVSDLQHPFSREAILQLAKHMPMEYQADVYELLNRDWAALERSPLTERLLWEKVRLADHLISADAENRSPIIPKEQLVHERQETAEALLIQFPNGYYADLIRQQQSQDITNASL